MKWDARIIRPHKIATTISLIQQFIESEPRKMKKKKQNWYRTRLGERAYFSMDATMVQNKKKKSSGRLLLEYPFFAGP